MEWTTTASLELIDAYHEQSVLWDPKHPHYYSKTRKIEAWKAVAQTMNTDVEEVRKKMVSLLGSFRREKSKERRSAFTNIGGSNKQAYVSKWFAYERLMFLLTRQNDYKHEGGLMDMETVDIVDADIIDDETEDMIPFENHYLEDSKMQANKDVQYETDQDEDVHTAAVETFHVPEPPRPKRQKSYSEESQSSRAMQPPDWSYDECSVYGQYVANKMRHYKSRTRSLVEHAINNILFEADMGRYDNATPHSSFQSVDSHE